MAISLNCFLDHNILHFELYGRTAAYWCSSNFCPGLSNCAELPRVLSFSDSDISTLASAGARCASRGGRVATEIDSIAEVNIAQTRKLSRSIAIQVWCAILFLLVH